MSASALEVSWGEAIVVAAFRAPRGLNGAVQAIQREVGPTIGSRNTFGKYLRMDSPTALTDKDRFRVWLLLTALGADPSRWGIDDDVVPRGYDLVRLKEELARPEGLEPPTFWSVKRVPLRLAS